MSQFNEVQSSLENSFLKWKNLKSVQKEANLSKYSKVRIGGKANYLWEPCCKKELMQYWPIMRQMKIPVFIMGRGSNVLFLDEGFKGVVVSLKKMPTILKEDKDRQILSIEGDVYLPSFVKHLLKNKFKGAVDLVGIPGGILGSVCQNAGAGPIGICRYIQSIKYIDQDGRVIIQKLKESDYSYRKGPVIQGGLLIGLEYKIEKEEKEIDLVQQKLEKRIQTQPLEFPSLGCVFKNTKSESAGKLIEEAGLKGYRIGGIEVSKKHSNFFINKGNGTAKDFLNLIEETVKRVYERSRKKLDLEIQVVENQ